MAESQKVTMGRTVFATILNDGGTWVERSAVVTRVWNETCVQLTVSTDASNDFGDHRTHLALSSATYNEDATAVGTWRWPPRS